MRRLCLLGCTLAAALMIGCKETVDDSVFLVDASQAVEADLTDVATDFRIIRLKSDTPLDTDMDYFFFDKWILGLTPNEGRGHQRANLFDKEGNLVSVLNRVGRGPGEYLGIAKIVSLDEENGILYFIANMDVSVALLKYSVPDFAYLGKVELDLGYEFRQIAPLDGGHFLALLDHDGDGEGHYSGVARTVLFDVNNLSDTVVLYTDTWNRHNNGFESFAKGINRHNPLLRTMGYVNIIYRIEDKRLTPALRFTFGSNGVPQKVFDDTEKDQDNEDVVTSIYGGVMNYVLDNDGCHIPFIFDAAQNGDLISFMYVVFDSESFSFNSYFYLNDGRKSVSYSQLNIPGLNVNASVSAIDQTMYAWEIPNRENLVDESVPMSGLAREILDSVAVQNDDNPVLLEYRFKSTF